MTRRISALFILSAVIGAAQSTDEALYNAIRNDEIQALGTLVKANGVDHKDSRGQTPLMFAAAYGSSRAFRLLLDAKADVNAVSDLGVTALHWAVGDVAKVRLLLSKGANVNVKSQSGRTPLLVAASTHGASAVVKELLAKGADVEAADAQGFTPLYGAATANDLASVRLLLDRGADPNARMDAGFSALMSAAGSGNLEMARLLIAHKADVNAVSKESSGRVKNGLIAIGFMTPLHWAAVNGGPEMVKLLLDAGANIDRQDVRGMTPLMSAFGTDHANPEVIRLLLAKGADTKLRSKTGETASDWAHKFNNPAVLPLLDLKPETSRPTAALAAGAVRPSPRQAVERALVPVQKATDYVFKDSGCVACHAQPVTEMAVSLARARGWRVDEPLSKLSLNSMRTEFSSRGANLLLAIDAGGLPDGLMYSAMALNANNVAPNAGTDIVVYYLLAKQQAGGNWAGRGGSRAPIQDGDFSRTALGIRALTAYGMPGRKAEIDRRVAQAAKWLAAESPFATEPRVMQLLGLRWASAEPKLQATRLRELIALQRPDGGWAQTPNLASDAYATGQVLYAFHEMGVPASDAAFRQGIDFLLRTQQTDGTWYVKNRAMKLQPYFESGFPYEHDQWISMSGTAWAAMALALSEPEGTSVASGR